MIPFSIVRTVNNRTFKVWHIELNVNFQVYYFNGSLSDFTQSSFRKLRCNFFLMIMIFDYPLYRLSWISSLDRLICFDEENSCHVSRLQAFQNFANLLPLRILIPYTSSLIECIKSNRSTIVTKTNSIDSSLKLKIFSVSSCFFTIIWMISVIIHTSRFHEYVHERFHLFSKLLVFTDGLVSDIYSRDFEYM